MIRKTLFVIAARKWRGQDWHAGAARGGTSHGEHGRSRLNRLACPSTVAA